MIRSKLVNAILLGFGTVLLLLDVVILLNRGSERGAFPTETVLFLTVVGGWCAGGALSNLFRANSPSPVNAQPVASYTLVRWNILIIIGSLAGAVASLVFENAGPDKGPFLTFFGLTMLLSILCAPITVSLYAFDKWRKRHRTDAGA